MSYLSFIHYMHRKNTVYVLFNKKLNLYKFGITELNINDKAKHYCITNNIDLSDVDIVFSYIYENGVKVENLLNKCINGKRVKLPNSNYYYKEHFKEEQLENILNILKSEITNENRLGGEPSRET